VSQEKKNEVGEISRREFMKDAGLIAGSAAIGTAGLLAASPVQTASAQAAAPVTLNVYDPSGAVSVTQLFAKRLDTLDGKTICELSDGMWQYDRTFDLINQLLKKQFPTVKIIDYKNFAQGITQVQDSSVTDAVKKAKCDAVIVGNAG